MNLVLGLDYVFTGRKIRNRNEILVIRPIGCIPAGFLSDGASIPRFADDWFGLDPLRREYLYAALHHDYNYAEKRYNRLKCDILFLKNIIFGSKRLLRFIYGPIMFISVRFGGFSAYYGWV